MRVILLIVLLSVHMFSAHAQFLNSLKARAKMAAEETLQRKTEDKVAQKTDQAAEKVLEAPFALLRGAKGGKGNKDLASALEAMSGATQATFAASYDFHTEMVIEVSVAEGRRRSQQITQFYGDRAMMTKVEGIATRTIFDFDNRSSLVLNDDNKSGVALSMDFLTGMLQEEIAESLDDTPASFRRTGNTKQILGYVCHEYVGEDDEAEFVGWFTDALGSLQLPDKVGSLSGTTDIMKGMTQDEKGMPLEMTTKTKDKGEISTMRVLGVRKIPLSVLTSDYTFPNFNWP